MPWFPDHSRVLEGSDLLNKLNTDPSLPGENAQATEMSFSSGGFVSLI